MGKQRNLLALLKSESPVLSIVLNVKGGLKNSEANRLLFKNLVHAGKDLVLSHYSREDWQGMALQLKKQQAPEFWQPRGPGLLVLVTPVSFTYFRLPFTLTPHVMVADIPYILPLLEDQQRLVDYNILCLTSDSMKILGVEQRVVKEVSLPADAPTTMEAALDLADKTSRLAFTGQGSERVSFYGLGSKSEEVEKNIHTYYHIVDEYVLGHLSHFDKRPLILFTLPTNGHVFRRLSHNPYLEEKVMIAHSPNELTQSLLTEQLQVVEKAWQVQALGHLKRQLETEYHRGKITVDLEAVKGAVQEGRIAQLWLAREVAYKEENSGLFNQLAYHVLQSSGTIYLNSQADLPAQNEHVAWLRY